MLGYHATGQELGKKASRTCHAEHSLAAPLKGLGQTRSQGSQSIHSGKGRLANTIPSWTYLSSTGPHCAAPSGCHMDAPGGEECRLATNFSSNLTSSLTRWPQKKHHHCEATANRQVWRPGKMICRCGAWHTLSYQSRPLIAMPMKRVRTAATSGAPRKMRTLRQTSQKEMWSVLSSPRYCRDTTCGSMPSQIRRCLVTLDSWSQSGLDLVEIRWEWSNPT